MKTIVLLSRGNPWVTPRVTLITVAVLLCLAPARAHAQDETAQALIQQRVERLREAGALEVAGNNIAALQVLPAFYVQRDHQPAWIDPDAVADLLRAIDDSEHDGLMPRDYHRDLLHRLWNELQSAAAPNAQTLADFDLLATDALLRLSYHSSIGKVHPERLDPNWNITYDLENLDPVTTIQHAIESGALHDFIASIKPKHRYFTGLKAWLAKYRALAAEGGWQAVPGEATLKPGMTDPRVATLRARLAVSGDLSGAGASDAELFDDALEEAVKRFQERHRLTADGIVGKGTLAELSVPVETRIDQIRINLERGRWVLQDLPETFVLANIAGFHAGLIDDDEIVWGARAQVGKPFRKTPLFQSDMKYIVFNPTWTVPPTILAKDVLPAIQRDVGYLQKKNMEVLEHSGGVIDPATLNWSQYSGRNFPYIIRQKPGPHNVLGRVKFIFPNKHFVFLHDTPSRALFERETRTFSSGCIRLENPLELAELLLDDAETWNAESIARLIESGENKTVYLREPIPVLLIYYTARVDEQGRLNFIRDVYERDANILAELNAEFN